MQLAKFGQTGLTVSRLCPGTATFGKQSGKAESRLPHDGRPTSSGPADPARHRRRAGSAKFAWPESFGLSWTILGPSLAIASSEPGTSPGGILRVSRSRQMGGERPLCPTSWRRLRARPGCVFEARPGACPPRPRPPYPRSSRPRPALDAAARSRLQILHRGSPGKGRLGGRFRPLAWLRIPPAGPNVFLGWAELRSVPASSRSAVGKGIRRAVGPRLGGGGKPVGRTIGRIGGVAARRSMCLESEGSRGGRRRGAKAMDEVTRLLDAIGGGEPQRARELLPLVYEELRSSPRRGWPARRRAGRSRRRPWCTRRISGWSATARGGPGTTAATSSPPRPRRCAGSWSRGPAEGRAKRGGDLARVRLDPARLVAPEVPGDILALDESLDAAGGRRRRARPRWSSSATSPG